MAFLLSSDSEPFDVGVEVFDRLSDRDKLLLDPIHPGLDRRDVSRGIRGGRAGPDVALHSQHQDGRDNPRSHVPPQTLEEPVAVLAPEAVGLGRGLLLLSENLPIRSRPIIADRMVDATAACRG
jgi:hypothetical protein